MSIKFADSEKTIVIPSTLVFTDASGDKHEVQSNEVEFNEVRDEFSQDILAINMQVEIDECGTVTNNVILDSKVDHIKRKIVSEAFANVGYYNENTNNSYDERSYDTNLTLSKDTLKKVKVKHK